MSTAQAQAPVVVLVTTLGNIEITLDRVKAPKSVENFLQYVKEGFYDKTLFHRVIPGFVVQGGGYDAKVKLKDTRAPVENEAKNGLRNARGTISMARTQAPHSATSQFYINLQDNQNLDHPSFDGWGYSVFGQVTSGMTVVDDIAKSKTGNVAGMSDVPIEPILIDQAYLKDAEK